MSNRYDTKLKFNAQIDLPHFFPICHTSACIFAEKQSQKSTFSTKGNEFCSNASNAYYCISWFASQRQRQNYYSLIHDFDISINSFILRCCMQTHHVTSAEGLKSNKLRACYQSLFGVSLWQFFYSFILFYTRPGFILIYTIYFMLSKYSSKIIRLHCCDLSKFWVAHRFFYT